MQLRFSVLARNRAFAKAMRRVRTKLQPLLDAFEATPLDFCRVSLGITTFSRRILMRVAVAIELTEQERQTLTK